MSNMTYTITFDVNRGFVYSYNYVHSLEAKREVLKQSDYIDIYVWAYLN